MGLAVGDIVALTYESTYLGQQIRYALHYRVSTAGSSTTAESDLAAMGANFGSTVANALTAALQGVHLNSFNFDSNVCQRVSPSRTIGIRTLSSFPGSIAGGDSVPNSSVVITKRTLTPGRRGLGSLHLAGYDSNIVVGGEIGAGSVSAFNPLRTELISARSITAVGMVVEPGLFNPTLVPSFFSRLFDTQLQLSMRVMRRRTVRVGI